MDLTLFITIIIVIVVAYLFIRFVVSPILRVIFGIIIFLVFIYLLQRFFGFDIGQILKPFGLSVNLDKLYSSISWILTPISYLIDKAEKFFNFISGNVPKIKK